MPWRRQMRSAISRASGSMLERVILELMAYDHIRPLQQQFGGDAI
jgi:hypothetical protein